MVVINDNNNDNNDSDDKAQLRRRESNEERLTDYSSKGDEVTQQFLDDQPLVNPVENDPSWKPNKAISSRRTKDDEFSYSTHAIYMISFILFYFFN